MGIKVKTPNIIKINNKGTKDFVNNWSVGGRTHHIDVRYLYASMMRIEPIPSKSTLSDLFTKTLNAELFKKHL
jgi:hypothetical protein